ncbi:pilus assembly FimT family protein [Jeongeupia chitinilytica]|uniref:Prepilin-type N-terminal cleavage/methylation domain-containing protein n=1 Tax=Jeongeupia chitinilytica TaxID=1041641 RepID=A0ABQ3H562_9NEIS|nr:prepilin-type N-terminal cleavage/methylation domain-containing protein [Jeongeupia chitinilytica]GHD67513.1 hypothetical protein GCM10007350_31310 [Jeongeupia chitinilytica]
MVRQCGFTLIELIITIAILALLLAVGVPFTQRWGQSARVQQVESTLKQGFAHAKAIALRNPNGVKDGTATAAVLTLTGDSFFVCEGAPSSCGASNAVWQASKSANTSITIGANTAWSLGLTAQGLAASSNYTVSDGNESATGNLH